MKTVTLIGTTLLSGAVAGTILAILNLAIVEPFIEQAIAFENQRAEASGDLINPVEFASYRIWQRGGQILAGTILGASIASLFGVVFACSRTLIPVSSNKRKALILAGVMWFILFLVPALKYPGNPPAVGDPETIYHRQTLYIAFISISGFSALGLAFLYRKLGDSQVKKAVALPAAYAVIMIAAYLAMPANPDQITAPMDLVMSFRMVSAFTMSIFWGLMGLILGSFWDKLSMHKAVASSRV